MNSTNELQSASLDASIPSSSVRWRIVALLVFASFISYVLRYNVSTAGPTLVDEFGLSERQFGWVLAAFTAGYAMFQFPGGLVVGRFGPRRVLACAMILWGLLTLVTGLIPAGSDTNTTGILLSLIVVRFFVGIAHAPIYPSTGGVVEKWFPANSRALPNGLSSAGLTLGIAATAPLVAWLMHQFGWRTSFALFAPLAFIGAALWWWYARDEPEHHVAVNAAELSIINEGREPVSSDTSLDSAVWWRVLKNRNVLLLMLSYFCMNYVFYQMFNWVYYYLVSVRNVSEQHAGLLTSTQWISGALGAAIGGFLCDYLCRRLGLRWGCRLPAVVGLITAGALLVLGAWSNHSYVAVVALASCFLFHQMTEGAYWAAAINIGGRHAAAACGVMNTGGNTVGFVNALLVPFVATKFGWTMAVATGGVFALVAAILWLFIKADQKVAQF